MLRLLISLTAAALLISVVGASAAAAQDTDERARLHFNSGTAYFDAGEYEDALREFRNAHELSQRAGLLYNLYLCEERLGNLDEAVTHLERYLADADDVGDRRGVLETRLANLRERAEAQHEGTVAPAPLPEPDPEVEPQPEPPSDSTTSPSPAPTRDDSGGGGVPLPAIIALGVGGAGAVTWAAFGILALSEHGGLTDSCAPTCSSDEVSSLDTYNLLADIGFVVTLAGAAAGVFLWLFLDGDEEEEQVAVAPWFTPDGGGVVARGSL